MSPAATAPRPCGSRGWALNRAARSSAISQAADGSVATNMASSPISFTNRPPPSRMASDASWSKLVSKAPSGHRHPLGERGGPHEVDKPDRQRLRLLHAHDERTLREVDVAAQ